MPAERIKESIDTARTYLAEHPEDAHSPDKPATAVLESGLRCRVEGPGWVVVTDMPAGVGGDASAPTPGWLARAALASCEAAVIAMRAAERGISLDSLEVTVESESDSRGLLGIGDAPAGPTDVCVRVQATGEGLDSEALGELIAWAEQHSPVGDIFRRAITPELEATAEPAEVMAQ
jgi:uncharacterized OsmC-like protein